MSPDTTQGTTRPDGRAFIVPPGFPARTLGALLLVALALRLATNASNVDDVNGEFLSRGALAEALRTGEAVWPAAAPQIAHLRGSVVMSVLAVPFFELLGPTTFALRLTGIVFHLAALALFMLLAHRQFGPRAARLAGALFALCPPGLAQGAILSYGDHLESLPFVLLATLLALAFLDERAGRRPALGFAAGLCAGLAVSWHAQARLGVAAVLLAALALQPRALARRDVWTGGLPGLLVGLLPLALGDWVFAAPGLATFGRDPLQTLAAGARGDGLDKWLAFWSTDLAAALQFRAAHIGPLVVCAALVSALVLALAGLAARGAPGGRRAARLAFLRRTAPIAAWPLLFSAVYATSRFRIHLDTDNAVQVRFLLPIVPVAVLLPLAVGAARLIERGRGAAGALLALPPLGAGLYGSLATIDVASLAQEPPRRAALWDTHGVHLLWNSLVPEERGELRALALSRYGDPEQQEVLRAFVDRRADIPALLASVARLDAHPSWTWPLRYRVPRLADGLIEASDAASLRRAWAALPEAQRPWAVSLAAQELAREAALRVELACALLALPPTPDERRHCARAFGVGLANLQRPRRLDPQAVCDRIESLREERQCAQIAFGFGFRTGQIVNAFYPPGDLLVDGFLAEVRPQLHADFARGLGWGYRLRLLRPPARELDSPALRRLLARLPAPLEEPFRDGLAGLEVD